jgi:hypothetical protein
MGRTIKEIEIDAVSNIGLNGVKKGLRVHGQFVDTAT